MSERTGRWIERVKTARCSKASERDVLLTGRGRVDRHEAANKNAWWEGMEDECAVCLEMEFGLKRRREVN